MSDPASDRELISEDKARELADRYLHERYYEFEKIIFTSIENGTVNENPVFHLYGTIRLKSRSIMDKLIIDQKAYSYKFMVEMNAVNGHIINYEFQ
ncbi:MAG: hypothetical protein EHM12_04235 [Dehalococcoidia bacterium]|nr:MAG: hypothetical protein EHM12_04235 [Dehalococcoidia bacterium]